MKKKNYNQHKFINNNNIKSITLSLFYEKSILDVLIMLDNL